MRHSDASQPPAYVERSSFDLGETLDIQGIVTATLQQRLDCEAEIELTE